MTKMIALTGGPCGGKSSAKAILKQKLPEMGITPLFVPESATILLGSGLDFDQILKNGSTDEFQKLLFQLQLQAEEVFHELSMLQEKSVIICDRGLLDGLAYMDYVKYLELAKSFGLDMTSILNRYDAVIHLVTAADGAVEYYSLENSARTETPEEAIKLDSRIQQCWNGHPRFSIIQNEINGKNIGFGEKMDWMLKSMNQIIGSEMPIKSDLKYIIKPFDVSTIPVDTQKITIKQIYLVTTDKRTERRIRIWTRDGVSTYFYTEKVDYEGSSRFNKEYEISADDYIQLLSQADASRRPLEKTRYFFPYQGEYFQLDVFENLGPLLYLLETQAPVNESEIVIPHFMDVLKNVTGDARYNNANIARRFV